MQKTASHEAMTTRWDVRLACLSFNSELSSGLTCHGLKLFCALNQAAFAFAENSGLMPHPRALNECEPGAKIGHVTQKTDLRSNSDLNIQSKSLLFISKSHL
jgi:hypothetical protein